MAWVAPQTAIITVFAVAQREMRIAMAVIGRVVMISSMVVIGMVATAAVVVAAMRQFY